MPNVAHTQERVGIITSPSHAKAKLQDVKLNYLALFLLVPVLAACDIFGTQTAPLSDKCYTNPTSTDDPGAAQLALGAANAAYVPGRVLVSYHEGSTNTLDKTDLTRSERARSVRMQYGLKTLSTLGGDDRDELVALPKGVSLETMLSILRADPRVRYAEPDRYLYPQAIPNDPAYSEQWNMEKFGLPEAWALETGKSDIVIAVLDSGVDLTHEDLVGRSVPGCDLYNGDNDPSPGSPAQIVGDQRHGTHVAGIALATGNNGKGVAGVAYSGVRLLPVKVFDDSGTDAQRTATSVVAKAIRWAAGLSVEGMNRNPYPAQVINLSLGGSGTVETLNDAVADARAAGSLVIAASGNSGLSDTIFTPANAPGAIAVGSIDELLGRSDFSNYDSNGRSVDIMAPGGLGDSTCGSIYSTLSPSFEGSTESEYGCERGTSMAAPFVAGVAALIWSQNPALTDDEVAAKLLASTNFTADMNQAEYGAGVICADRALGAATLCGE